MTDHDTKRASVQATEHATCVYSLQKQVSFTPQLQRVWAELCASAQCAMPSAAWPHASGAGLAWRPWRQLPHHPGLLCAPGVLQTPEPPALACTIEEAGCVGTAVYCKSVWRRGTSTHPSIQHRSSYFFGAQLSNALNIYVLNAVCWPPVGPQDTKYEK